MEGFFSKVSPSSYLGRMEGFAGNSKPLYEICDPKSENFAIFYIMAHSPGLWD